MKKNRKNAATTALISRASTGASQVTNRRGSERFVVVVIARGYTGLSDGWNAADRLEFAETLMGVAASRAAGASIPRRASRLEPPECTMKLKICALLGLLALAGCTSSEPP